MEWSSEDTHMKSMKSLSANTASTTPTTPSTTAKNTQRLVSKQPTTFINFQPNTAEPKDVLSRQFCLDIIACY